MEKRIALELRGRTPAQVNELNLDNCRSTNIVGLTDEYCNLETLSLNNVGLTSLKGFPALPNLKRLELSDNRISCGLNFLNGSPKLTHLNVSGNKIRLLEDLQPLKDFGKLKNLDLFNNDVTNIEDYRKQVFALNPSLKYLDGFDQKDREAEDSDGEGEEDELNGNNDSDGDVEGADEDGDLDDMAIDFGSLVLDDTVSRGHTTTPWPVVVYTVFGLLFHMGSLIQRSDEEDDDEDEGEDISLSAVYNDNLEEESSESSLFDGSSGGDGEDDEDEIDEEDENEAQNNTNAAPGQEESTRGKKRKHEEDGGEPEN